MDTETLVYADLRGRPVLLGRLWARTRKRRDSATFEYDEGWLAHRERFSLDPALRLGPGSFHTAADKTMFGAIGDSAPDRWGRVLMRRAERRRAELTGDAPRTLREIDYLLMVNDEARQGALRFALRPGGPFLASSDATPIPPLLELPRLLSAAANVVGDSASDADLRLLLAPGSSLGGARPKSSVRDRDGQLLIAKFPQQGDEIDAVRWEAVALSLAQLAGIQVPQWRIEAVAGKPVLLLRRFDRAGAVRVPFLSAMSMLGANDNEVRSYLAPLSTRNLTPRGQVPCSSDLAEVRSYRSSTSTRRRAAAIRDESRGRHARALAARCLQRADLEYRRPSTQSWLSL